MSSDYYYYSPVHIFDSRSKSTEIVLKAGEGKTLMVSGYTITEKSSFKITGLIAQIIPNQPQFEKLTSYWNGTPSMIGTDMTYDNAGNITINTAGRYYITYNVVFGVYNGSERGAVIAVNNDTTDYFGHVFNVATLTSTRTGLNGSDIIDLVENDVVSIQVRHTVNGVNLPMLNSANNIGTWTIVKLQ